MKSPDLRTPYELNAIRQTNPPKLDSRTDRGATIPVESDAATRVDAVIHEADWAKQVAEWAYFRAERRGFEPGAELQDWLEAEREFAKHLVAVKYGIARNAR